MNFPDYIIIGSGCTGAMAAETLAGDGHSVMIIDGGITDEGKAEQIPDRSYTEIRKQDDNQEKFFLGDRFESLNLDKTSTGAQLTPARMFLTAETEKYLRLVSDNFFPIESLAVGGLGGGWGLGCCVFSEQELRLAGLDPSSMNKAYQTVADRIGISGENDDARNFTSRHIDNIQPATEISAQASFLLRKYQTKKSALNSQGFYLGRPALALLTKDKQDRNALQYRDMDFYDDHGHSAWRAWMTIDELKKKPNVIHEPGWTVISFREEENSITVNAIRIGTNEKKEFRCRKLILSPGPLATARIVLRSLPGGMEKQLPVLCNSYNYTPLLIPRLLGNEIQKNHLGFAQLSLFHDRGNKGDDIAMASIYSYHALQLFRLLKETPLNFRDGRIAMKYLLPAIVIAGIHHPEKQHSQFLSLRKDESSVTGDHLFADYRIDDNVRTEIEKRENSYRRTFRKLGAWALKRVTPGTGSSVHYAGVLPFSESDTEFTLTPTGKLGGCRNVYVADGSGFKFLPAKGLTLSLMANAHNVAQAAGK